VQSTCIILPNTIVPSSDDVFILEYQNVRKVFIVTDVEQDNYNNAKYFKITFRLSTFNIEDVNKQVAEEFTVDYNLLGTVKNPVVLKTRFELTIALEGIMDVISRSYLEDYYNNEVNGFVDKRSDFLGRSIICTLVSHFVRVHKLTSLYKDYRAFNYISADISKDLRMGDFNSSIYGIIAAVGPPSMALSIPTEFTQKRCILELASSSRYALNWMSAASYYMARPIKDSATVEPTDEIITPIPADFLAEVSANTLTDTNPYKVFLTKAFNGYYNDTNYHEIPADVGFLEDFPDNYYIVPLVLFSLRYYRGMVSG